MSSVQKVRRNSISLVPSLQKCCLLMSNSIVLNPWIIQFQDHPSQVFPKDNANTWTPWSSTASPWEPNSPLSCNLSSPSKNRSRTSLYRHMATSPNFSIGTTRLWRPASPRAQDARIYKETASTWRGITYIYIRLWQKEKRSLRHFSRKRINSSNKMKDSIVSWRSSQWNIRAAKI